MVQKLSPKLEKYLEFIKPKERVLTKEEVRQFAQESDYYFDDASCGENTRIILATDIDNKDIEFVLESLTVEWNVSLSAPDKIYFVPKIQFRYLVCRPKHRKGLESRLFYNSFIHKFLGLESHCQNTPQPFVKSNDYPTLRLPYDVMTIEEAQEWLAKNSDQIARFYQTVGVNPVMD